MASRFSFDSGQIAHCWLSPKILEWSSGGLSGDSLDEAKGLRAYEIWAHAERTLLDNDDEHHRTDAITNLNRAVVHRVRLLAEAYDLHNIRIATLPKRSVKILEYLGVIRPLMVRRLADIRNAVEHEDTPPPSRAVCNTLVEFVWYFLRSTDSLTKRSVDEFSLKSPEKEAYWIVFESGPKHDWHLKFHGWIRPEWISEVAEDRWISASVEVSETREECIYRLGEDYVFPGGLAPSDIMVGGRILGPDEHLRSIISQVFRGI